MAVFTASTAGTLCIVLRICRFWYRWHRLHHPFEPVSLSTPILSTWEKVVLGALPPRTDGFGGGYIKSLTCAVPGRVVSLRQFVHLIVTTADVARIRDASSSGPGGCVRLKRVCSSVVETGVMLRYSWLILSNRNLLSP